jgi:hypothetical protein
MFCQVHLHFSVPINFQPTQQNARARRSSYASADNDGTSYLHNLISELLEVQPHTALLFFFCRELESACRGVDAERWPS